MKDTLFTHSIGKVKLECWLEPDLDPDTSWIGEFSNTPGEAAIEHIGDSREFKYFNPANPEYAQQDYEHMLRLVRGDIAFYGILASISIAHADWYKGKEIGRAAVWGYELDAPPDAQFMSEARNIASLALTDARDFLRSLANSQ
mgnify:CR=1 FL=1